MMTAHETNYRGTETQRFSSKVIPLVTLCLCVFVVRFTGASQGAATGAPTTTELQNATFAGFGQPKGAITLSGGRWEGADDNRQGSARLRITLVPGFRITGDLDGDGREEAGVLLGHSSGGSGERVYLAIVGRMSGRLQNMATTLVGDRVQIRDGRIASRAVSLDVVHAGPKDALCCPGDLLTRRWTLSKGTLMEQPPASGGRLSLDALAGTTWTLRSWRPNEPFNSSAAVTLRVQDGTFTGSAGCNTYRASVTPGAGPGEIKVGAAIATRMACPEPAMSVETRYLRALQAVTRFGFAAGQLALTYQQDVTFGTLLFERTMGDGRK